MIKLINSQKNNKITRNSQVPAKTVEILKGPQIKKQTDYPNLK